MKGFMMRQCRPQAESGFTLIEVLVSMLILMIGLLGVATAQLTSFANNQNAYMRSQATVLTSEFMDRIRSNREGRELSLYDNISITNTDTPAAQACITSAGGCSAAELVQQDIHEFAKYISNVNGQDGYKPRLPNGAISVSRDSATDEYVVTVSWTEKDWDEDTDGKTIRGDSVDRSVQMRTYVR